jgi:hypothetical protein
VPIFISLCSLWVRRKERKTTGQLLTPDARESKLDYSQYPLRGLSIFKKRIDEQQEMNLQGAGIRFS